MGMAGILLYLQRASLFGLVICALYCLACYMIKHPILRSGGVWRLLLMGYLAALVQIVVIRDWSSFLTLSDNAYSLLMLQLLPLRTTWGMMENGLWMFLYHLIGNLIWFVPLGVLLPMAVPKWGSWRRVACFGVCLSLALEVGQFLFATGVSDVDDLILNTLGGLCGYGLLRLGCRICGGTSF